MSKLRLALSVVFPLSFGTSTAFAQMSVRTLTFEKIR